MYFLYFFFAAKNCVVSVVLWVLVTPALVAAWVAVKVELNESTATAAIRMLRVRIKFLPMFKTSIAQSTPNVSRSSPAIPLRANSRHSSWLFNDVVRANGPRYLCRADRRDELAPPIRPRRGLQRQDIRHRAWFARPTVFDFSHGVRAGAGNRNVARQPGLCSPV